MGVQKPSVEPWSLASRLLFAMSKSASFRLILRFMPVCTVCLTGQGGNIGCGSKPMVPLWDRCTTHFSLFQWGLGRSLGDGILTHSHMVKRRARPPCDWAARSWSWRRRSAGAHCCGCFFGRAWIRINLQIWIKLEMFWARTTVYFPVCDACISVLGAIGSPTCCQTQCYSICQPVSWSAT